MLDQALTYAQRGWAVFPCKDKIPLTAHGYKDASTNIEAVRKMFEGKKNANIAIATGKVSGIFVVDIDVKNGSRGDDSIREFEQEHGELPETVESLTWSGGRHLYFKYPDQGIGCKVGIRDGIDIRGDGGCVITPPSVIKGKKYEWEIAHHPDDVKIADAPDWLIDILTEKQPEVDLSDNGAKITVNRNDALMRMGVGLRKMGLEHEQIESMLQSINTKRCSPPLPKKEISNIAKSVSRYSVDTDKLPTGVWNDIWNSEMFVSQHGEVVKNCDVLGGWFVWDGKRWKKDDTHLILQMAKNTVDTFYSIAEQMDKKVKTAFYKHIKSSGNEGKLRAMANVARSSPGISVTSDEFDSEEYMLNCENGVLDLQNNRFLPHSPDLLITKICNTRYDKNAECPNWLSFLDTIFHGDKELIAFIQKVVGYALTGDVSMQMFFILYGNGANGKSTFVETMYRMLGTYAAITPISTLMVKKDGEIPNDVARLKGMRFIMSSELEQSKRLDESLVKQLTSEEPIIARFLHREFFEFKPTGKIFLSTNYKPTIRGTDDGIWRRIKLIPFTHKFQGDKKIEKYAEKYLFPELSGILRWSVEGYQKWKKYGLHEPESVRCATDDYKLSEDEIGKFIDEYCVIQPGSRAVRSELYNLFKEKSERRIRKKDFNDYLEKQGFFVDMGTSGIFKGKQTWHGIGIRCDESEVIQFSEERPY